MWRQLKVSEHVVWRTIHDASQCSCMDCIVYAIRNDILFCKPVTVYQRGGEDTCESVGIPEDGMKEMFDQMSTFFEKSVRNGS